MLLDFTTSLSLSLTAIISLVSIFFLVKPFLVGSIPDSKTNKNPCDTESELRMLDSLSSRNLILDSLEELELSRASGLLSEQEYIEQKELLMKDAATQLNQDTWKS